MAGTVSVREMADQLEAHLRTAGTPERAVREKAYLKSDLVFVGASVPQTRLIAKAFRRDYPDVTRMRLRDLVVELWQRGVHECRMTAVELLDLYSHLITVEDLRLIERLLREARTWALVDGLAVSVVGALVERDPDAVTTLDQWASDGDFWLRRSALLALLPGLRRGEGDFERFAGYADGMLDEREFFIRKAIGWVTARTSSRPSALCATVSVETVIGVRT